MKRIKRWIEKIRVALQWKDYEIDGTSIAADKRFFIVQADSVHMAVEKEIVPELGEPFPSNKSLRLVKVEATPTLGNIWSVIAVYEANGKKPSDCRDCGSPYETTGVDMVLPDQQWKRIMPEDGILCPTCICKRLDKLGCVSVVCWALGMDFDRVYKEEQAKEIKS